MNTSPVSLSMSPLVWVMLVVLSLLWGGSFFFVGVAVTELPTLTIVLLRVGIAALFLWGAVLVAGHAIPRSAGIWGAFVAMGFLNNVIPFGLIVYGQQSISSGLASILNATTPLFTVIVAGALLADERVTLPKLIGVAIGFAGVAGMIGPGALSGLGGDLLAQFAILGAALSYAFAAVFGRRFQQLGINPLVTAAGQVTGSALLLLPFTLWVDRPWDMPLPSMHVVWSVLGLAVLSTAVAYFLYFRILQLAGATNLSLVTFLIPPSAMALGALFLAEQITISQLVGFALICVGLALIDGRMFKAREQVKA